MIDARPLAADLDRILEQAQLPALPQSAIRLLELSQDASNGPAEFAVPIEADPGLAGQVLRFVNSSYFGFSREISSVKLAITLVGVRTIKNFALWSAVFSLMPNPRCGPFDLKVLWQDSLRRGLFARAVGRTLGVGGAEEPFAAALLQDMAIPLLAKARPEAYAKLLDARAGGDVRLSELEREAFGWTHAEAAGVIARQWDLPESFAESIENHLEIDRWAARSDTEPQKLVVALSALLPTITDAAWAESARFERCFAKARAAGGPTMMELFEQVDREYIHFAPVLELTAPNKSLVDAYREVSVSAS